MISSSAQYALRAVVYLAQRDSEQPVPVDDVAAALDLPKTYLAKILKDLARADVLVSLRGKHGGFRLGPPASEISLLSVIKVFDRFDERRRCLMGRDTCSDEDACPVHEHWKSIGIQVAQFFSDTTVSDLVPT